MLCSNCPFHYQAKKYLKNIYLVIYNIYLYSRFYTIYCLNNMFRKKCFIYSCWPILLYISFVKYWINSIQSLRRISMREPWALQTLCSLAHFCMYNFYIQGDSYERHDIISIVLNDKLHFLLFHLVLISLCFHFQW